VNVHPIVIAVFLENSENDSKLNDWINFGIYWKNLLSHSRPWPWSWVCGLGLACLWPLPWLTGIGLVLDTSGLVNIPGNIAFNQDGGRPPFALGKFSLLYK